MSSAKKGLRAAGIGGLSVLLGTTAAMIGLAAPANADFAASGGEIGLVDTNTTSAANGTQGATLVYPGVAGQDLGDVRLLIPNTFKNGDTIDLAIFDRTATATNNGQINADTAHKLGFSAAPTVSVNPTPYLASTSIGASSADTNNTEGTGLDAPDADPNAATRATTPPVFTSTLVQSSRANGLANDIVRLTVNNVQAAGDITNEFIVTLSGLKADLGTAVSPGELRVVPFAYNGTPGSSISNASSVFGNLPDDPNVAGYLPVIETYTVPAYVAPVNFNVGSPNNIVADNTTQKVGDITISETNNFSLQDGVYTVTTSANVRNDASSPITVTATNAATGETVTKTGAANQIQFTVAGASNTSKLTVTISGLLLSTNAQGSIDYELTGGSIDNTGDHSFLVTAGDSLDIPAGYAGAPGAAGVYSDADFVTAGGDVNQTDIVAPAMTVSAVATALEDRIGGGDRYETAAKVALRNGVNDYVVLASGENFPDALSSAYLSNQIGQGSILLTKKNTLPAVTADAMRLLGTRTVYVVGDSNAISNAVTNKLKATPQYMNGGRETIGQGKLQVIRLGSTNRYTTNQRINEYAAANGTTLNPVGRTTLTFGESSKLTALVATGEKYADALAAGPATAGNGSGSLPLILTRGASLTAAAQSQLNNLGIQQVVIVGGTPSVSTGVENAIKAMGINVVRVAGDNRYETAADLADFENGPSAATSATPGGLGFDGETVYLATGEKFPDALAAAPLAGGSESPILLTRSGFLSPDTMTFLTVNAAQYENVVALGLAPSVSNGALTAANNAVSAR